MAPSHGNPDAVKDTKGPRQTHVAVLQPAAIERVRARGGDTEEEWRICRSAAVKASFLAHVGRHCTASSGIISAHEAREKEERIGTVAAPRHGGQGSTSIVRSVGS
ncbi:hypothetical protein TcG_11262 [Trypanosoma cruzi]|nr:hypothetical protein TcG_11262 [Trypanosoma cruzi]